MSITGAWPTVRVVPQASERACALAPSVAIVAEALHLQWRSPPPPSCCAFVACLSSFLVSLPRSWCPCDRFSRRLWGAVGQFISGLGTYSVLKVLQLPRGVSGTLRNG